MAAPAPEVPVQVGMAPFVATVSEPTPLPDGQVGLLVNCGLHASRVVGKGGAKIAELMTQTGATMRVTRNSGLCEICGAPDAVEHAKRLVLEIVEDGDTRDLRAAGWWWRSPPWAGSAWTSSGRTGPRRPPRTSRSSRPG